MEDAGGTANYADAVGRERIDLRGMLGTPLLSFLSDAGIQHHQARTRHAMQHGLSDGRTCLHHGDAGHLTQHIGKRLSPMLVDLGLCERRHVLRRHACFTSRGLDHDVRQAHIFGLQQHFDAHVASGHKVDRATSISDIGHHEAYGSLRHVVQVEDAVTGRNGTE